MYYVTTIYYRFLSKAVKLIYSSWFFFFIYFIISMFFKLQKKKFTIFDYQFRSCLYVVCADCCCSTILKLHNLLKHWVCRFLIFFIDFKIKFLTFLLNRLIKNFEDPSNNFVTDFLHNFFFLTKIFKRA